MTWHDKKTILARLGITGFESEAEYQEWYSELDEGPVKKRIRKAVCDGEEYGPVFDWSRNYFQINKTTKYGTEQAPLEIFNEY